MKNNILLIAWLTILAVPLQAEERKAIFYHPGALSLRCRPGDIMCVLMIDSREAILVSEKYIDHINHQLQIAKDLTECVAIDWSRIPTIVKKYQWDNQELESKFSMLPAGLPDISQRIYVEKDHDCKKE